MGAIGQLCPCAVSSGALLLAFTVCVTAKAAPEFGDANVAVECAEFSARRDRLLEEIERLRAETAVVEAELGTLCTESANQTNVGLPPRLALPSPSTGESTDDVAGMQHLMPQPKLSPTPNAEHPAPARRSSDAHLVYGVHCWAPNSAFSDPSCNCLGQAAHPALHARRTVRIIVGGWCVHPGLQSSACF
jgi:hypothetical protein